VIPRSSIRALAIVLAGALLGGCGPSSVTSAVSNPTLAEA